MSHIFGRAQGRRRLGQPPAVDVEDGGRCVPGRQLAAELIREDERAQRHRRTIHILFTKGGENRRVLAGQYLGIAPKQNLARSEILGKAADQKQHGEQAQVKSRQAPA